MQGWQLGVLQLSQPFSCRKPTFGSAERKTPVKKLVSEFSKVKGKTLKHSPVKEESSGSLSETVCKRELRSQETPEKTRSLLETPLRPSAPLKGPSSHPKEKGFFSEIDDLPYLSTTEMYLCRWHQPPPSPLPLREPSPKKEETVASKQWRACGGCAGRAGSRRSIACLGSPVPFPRAGTEQHSGCNGDTERIARTARVLQAPSLAHAACAGRQGRGLRAPCVPDQPGFQHSLCACLSKT